jgi:hypothetical protein
LFPGLPGPALPKRKQVFNVPMYDVIAWDGLATFSPCRDLKPLIHTTVHYKAPMPLNATLPRLWPHKDGPGRTQRHGFYPWDTPWPGRFSEAPAICTPAAVWSAARPSCSGVTRDPSLDRPLQDGLAGKPRAAGNTRSCGPQTVVVGGVDGTWCTYKPPPLTTPPSGANKGKQGQETPPAAQTRDPRAKNTHTHTHTAPRRGDGTWHQCR